MSVPTSEAQEHQLTSHSGRLSDRDEVWDGEYVVSPLATVTHQRFVSRLTAILSTAVDMNAGDDVFAGINVSDREAGWTHNFRIPDVAVVLKGNPAKDCGTHLCGGPDLVIEVVSKGDRARLKTAFYAAIGVREFWVIDRNPFCLELLRSDGVQFASAGTIEAGSTGVLQSHVVPLNLRVVTGDVQPRFEIRPTVGDRVWSI